MSLICKTVNLDRYTPHKSSLGFSVILKNGMDPKTKKFEDHSFKGER